MDKSKTFLKEAIQWLVGSALWLALLAIVVQFGGGVDQAGSSGATGLLLGAIIGLLLFSLALLATLFGLVWSIIEAAKLRQSRL